MSNPTYVPPPVTDADRVQVAALLADLMTAFDATAHPYGIEPPMGGTVAPQGTGGYLEALADLLLLSRGVRAAGQVMQATGTLSDTNYQDIPGATFNFVSPLTKTYTISAYPRLYRTDSSSGGWLRLCVSVDGGTSWTTGPDVIFNPDAVNGALQTAMIWQASVAKGTPAHPQAIVKVQCRVASAGMSLLSAATYDMQYIVQA